MNALTTLSIFKSRTITSAAPNLLIIPMSVCDGKIINENKGSNISYSGIDYQFVGKPTERVWSDKRYYFIHSFLSSCN